MLTSKWETSCWHNRHFFIPRRSLRNGASFARDRDCCINSTVYSIVHGDETIHRRFETINQYIRDAAWTSFAAIARLHDLRDFSCVQHVYLARSIATATRVRRDRVKHKLDNAHSRTCKDAVYSSTNCVTNVSKGTVSQIPRYSRV